MKKFYLISFACLIFLTGCSNDVVAKLHLAKIDVSEETEIRKPMQDVIDHLEAAENDFEKNDYVSLYEEDGTTVTHINGKRIKNLKFLDMTVYEVRYEFSNQIDETRPEEDLLIRAHYFVKPNKHNRTKEALEKTLSERFEQMDTHRKFWVDEKGIIFYEYTPNGQIRIMIEDRELFEQELITKE
ncbi:hypothetical protein [Pseudogracilibacillus sp. ICA-222130]|uniref:hypothetical protein n=1 Tax=Pseudogracilibacillus sp. ICA-222130 TaxID=3134655 RepID=UPI0030BEBD45